MSNGDSMTKFVLYKAGRFFPTKEYEAFSRILNRKEIVTIDMLLCEALFEKAPFRTEGDDDSISSYALLMFKSLSPNEQIIAYCKNPYESHKNHSLNNDFEFCGYDLSDEMTTISTITNCGGMFDKAISYDELNRFGLIDEYKSAFRIRDLLNQLYPDDDHACCEVYELWRRALKPGSPL